MTSVSSRHIACNRCRLKKVKCDGRTPWCKRCSGTGAELECSYETKRKHSKRQGTSPTPSSSISSSQFSSSHLATDPGLDESYRSNATSPSEEQFNESVLPDFPALNDMWLDTSPLPNYLEPLLSVPFLEAQDKLINLSQSPELGEKSMFTTDINLLNDATDLLFPSDALLGIETVPLEYLLEL
jgi:hypothetical protein